MADSNMMALKDPEIVGLEVLKVPGDIIMTSAVMAATAANAIR
jgi:hypothetical protein